MAKTQIINVDVMREPIVVTWNAIGGDLEAACAEGGIRLKNTDAIESCIDADRLTSFAYGEKAVAAAKAAEAELTRAIEAHGYAKVLRTLARAIQLA